MSPTISKIDLRELASINDEELFQTILSSADYFPGLYRYSLGTLPYPHDNLTYQQLVQAWVQQEYHQKQWTREQWLMRQFDIHKHTMEQLSGRNQSREDKTLALRLANNAYDRFTLPRHFALATVDLQTPITELSCNTTYMMMGSHIRFEDDTVLVGYDAVLDDTTLTLHVPWATAQRYIEKIFKPENISALFQRSEILAHLRFDRAGYGFLSKASTFEDWTELTALVFAGQIRNQPIRFAKPMGVSNVNKIS